MISIKNQQQLDTATLSPSIRSLINLRLSQIATRGEPLEELASFLIVQSGDTLAQVERETGYLGNWGNLPFEWVSDHGQFYEAPIIMNDDGFALVLLIEKSGIDPLLLKELFK